MLRTDVDAVPRVRAVNAVDMGMGPKDIGPSGATPAPNAAGTPAEGRWDQNLPGGTLRMSTRLQEMLGYDANEEASAPCTMHIHPDDADRVFQALRRHLETREPYCIEYRLRTRDGSYRRCEARGQAEWNPQGTPVRFSGVIRDIHAEKRPDGAPLGQPNIHAALQKITRSALQATRRSELLQEVCRIAVENAGFAVAWIGLLDEQSGRLEPVARHGSVVSAADRGPQGDAVAHSGLPEEAMRTSHCQVENDIRADDARTEPAPADNAGHIRAAGSFPLYEMGRPVGVLNLYSETAGLFDPDLTGLLDETAAIISLALDNLLRERGHRAAERALRVSDEQFRQLTATLPDVFWIADADARHLLYASPAYERLWGRPAAHAGGDDFEWLDAVHPDDQARVRANYQRGPLADFDEEFRVIRPDGSLRWVHARAFPVADPSGKVVRVTGIMQDITDRRDYEARLHRLAHFDGLTGLPNRLLFHDRLQQTLVHAAQVNATVAVMLVDIDRFRLVNDTLGHEAGDLLLQAAAQRLSHVIRRTDTLARLGGNEFALTLADLDAPEDAATFAQAILAAFELPFAIAANEIFMTVSIGISSYPVDTADSDALMRNADVAMYRAKELGGGSFQFHAGEMNARSSERLKLGNHLRRALERQEFLLQYQPRASLATGAITGFEARVRWNSPELGAVSSASFMPLLEENSQIIAVGDWVLDSACRHLRAWLDKGIVPVPIAVMLSGRQLHQPDLAAHIRSTLQKHDVEPRLIELDVTEGVLTQHVDRAVAVLRSLRATGLRIAIDEFGTGSSSLSSLKILPLDTLKIDATFVKDVIADGDAALITQAVVSMGARLGLRVVAAGVDTRAQLAFLATCGCDEIQGYYFSPPVSADDSTRMLADRHRLALPAAADAEVRTLLLVDDELRVLSALKRVLRREGYRILTAAGAAEGLELLACNRIGVVVTDQRMPEMPGVEFLHRVRELYPDTARIMLSGYTDFHSITDAINRGGVFKFLTKPWDDEQLRDGIEEAFVRHERAVDERNHRELRVAEAAPHGAVSPPAAAPTPAVVIAHSPQEAA